VAAGLAAGLILALLGALPGSARAADSDPAHTFVVNSTGDAGAAGSTSDGRCDTGATVNGQPECTLRAAVEEANGTAGADAVDATGARGTIQLDSTITISADLHITGPGANGLTVRGKGDDGGFRVVYVRQGDAVALSGLTISNGTAAGSDAVDAGGILSWAAKLTLDAVVVTGNRLPHASAGAGGVASAGISSSPTARSPTTVGSARSPSAKPEASGSSTTSR
jgi:CSLREA domain-containing protein